MADFETVDIDTNTIEVNFSKSDYAQVLFHNIAETYPVNAHIECRYTLTPSMVPTSRDWVGLYRVGWRSSSDHILYEWSPMPENHELGKPAENSILFQAYKLPKDDGEFYQFCYVTRSGHVRGASTPFQFKRPSTDDLVEVEDEDMLVIKTKTAVLEENLLKANTEKEDLDKTKTLLENERESLLCKLVELDRSVVAERDEKEEMRLLLGKESEKSETMKREATDMQAVHDGLREKLNVVNQEKETILKRLDENDAYIKSLQDKIKALINEKDALTGKNKALEEEKELFKNHFTNSESTTQGYVLEVDRLKQELLDTEKNSAKLKEEIRGLQRGLDSQRKTLERQTSISQADKNQIQGLSERLRNSEDKLIAAEHIKKLLNEEVVTLQQAFEKMSKDFEMSQSEAHHLKIQLGKLEEKAKQEADLLDIEISTLQTTIDEKDEEIKKLQAEFEQGREKLKCLESSKVEEQEGPLYALHMAQQHLKERYSKMKKMCEEQKKQLEELVARQKRSKDKELEDEQEIKDLKERLLMGQEEYKNRFIECQRLHKELKRAKRSPNRRSASSSVEKEFVQMSSASSSGQTTPTRTTGKTREEEMQTEMTTRAAAGTMTSDIADLTCSELQDQLNDLGRELEHRIVKKQKYKQLYHDEKDKSAFLQRHYFDELKQKEEVITKLKDQLQDNTDETSMRIAKLQSLLEEKEREIAALKRESSARQSLATRVYPAQTRFDNPYADYQPSVTYCGLAPPGYYPPQMIPTEPAAMAIARTVPVTTCPQAVLTSVLTACSQSGTPRELPRVGQEEPDVSELDPLNAEDTPSTLEAPLQPLPAPMLPVRLPSAKLAAIKAMTSSAEPKGLTDLFDRPGQGASGEQQDPHESRGEGGEEPSGPPPLERGDSVVEFVDAEEDRFMDAHGEPQQYCPVCNMIFDDDMSEQAIMDHVNNHYGPICPMCNSQFDSISVEQFQQHVQQHFDEDH